MSELASPPSRPVTLIAYGVVALAIAFELVVAWFMLHPQVPADYRAYYIDRTTTCLNQPVSGDYALGTTVSFRSDGLELAKPLRVCGWEGPAGDGTHAVGTSSRLRFAIPAAERGPLFLSLDMVAISREGHPAQRIGIEANGMELGVANALAGVPLEVDLEIPAETIAAGTGAVDVILHFPDAISMSPSDSDTRWRSVKLLSARLGATPRPQPK
nr:hypothetical protein [uncultured Devosia sp.]